MKDFVRDDRLLSLCGLNCGLCSMHLGDYCPGCGGGAGNQSCAIAKCSMQRGVTYCFECESFPCATYDGIDEFDSFITHRHQLKDLRKAQEIGIDAYQKGQAEKVACLSFLLINYNDGRKKSFFCVAVNLLDLGEIKAVIEVLTQETAQRELTLKEKAALAQRLFEEVASQHGISLKLRKKPRKSNESKESKTEE
ncbi:MAG: DUF3795 domain-containing protein [Clostridiales bacterium]|nr:DUF3795 domain-containing protein [Clostridiales bacterium]